MAAIAKGELVYASDGELLGTVTEVRAGHFKLDSPFTLDYWLPLDCLELRDDNLAVTSFPKADVDKFRVEAGSI